MRIKIMAAAWKKQNVEETSTQNTLFGGETDDFGGAKLKNASSVGRKIRSRSIHGSGYKKEG